MQNANMLHVWEWPAIAKVRLVRVRDMDSVLERVSDAMADRNHMSAVETMEERRGFVLSKQ